MGLNDEKRQEAEYIASLVADFLVKTGDVNFGEITVKITKVGGKYTRIRKSFEESELVDR